ncbi:MAG TPA: hypothetical protein VFD31_13230 [Thermoleophilaceae bacterium]|nr:hypothetical protein [Thermoleophilaceae bacterium]
MSSSPTADLSGRVAALPGMDRLLPALAGLPPTYLVGGVVRDLIVGRDSVDLDLTVEGDGVAAARELAQRLGGEASEHERFGTATVRAGDLVVDLATARRESYAHPGALPEVEPASLEEDLARRDFTVNAMAVALSEPGRGELRDPLGGFADLAVARIRVLHDRSFIDDPTRLLRALRYEARLGFSLERETERLGREAVAADALSTVSGARVRDELMDLLGEPAAPVAVGRMRDLGVAAALHPQLHADPELVASTLLGAGETGADRALTALAALISGDPVALEPFVSSLGLPASDRDTVLRAARNGPQLPAALREEPRASELHAMLAGEPPETLALALALGAPGDAVQRFMADLRGTRLEIGGQDLVDAGIPPSEAIGRALDETLRRKLDGELAGRDEELRTALELARGGA